MTMESTEFGDFPIVGSSATFDDNNPVPIYEFTPEKDGAHTIAVSLMAWQPGGATVQFYVQAAWRMNGGSFGADGAPFVGAVGTLTPNEVSIDVSNGKGRLMVSGIANEALLWRMKGQRFDLTVEKATAELPAAHEFGDLAIAGSAMTPAATTPVLIHEFTPAKDGAYTVQALLVAWAPGGRVAQLYVEANWKKIGNTVTTDGTLFSDGVGTLSFGGVTQDVSGGKARLLVTGSVSQEIFWRLKGVRLDLTA